MIGAGWCGRPARRRAAAVVVLVATTAFGGCGFSEPALSPITRESLSRVEVPPVKGKTAVMDVMAIDQAAHRLYVADALDLGIDVVDIAAWPGRYLRTIAMGVIPNGIVYVPRLRRLYTGNDDSTVSVIDADPAAATPYSILASIPIPGQGASDLIDYDPTHGKVYVTNPDDAFISAIDTATNTIVAKIPTGGFVEQPMFDPVDHMMYVAALDDNGILEIDPTTDKIVAKYTLNVTCEPHGLAVNPATNQGVIGCGDKDDQVTLAWDFTTHRTIGVFDQAGAGDVVVFDAQSQHFYFAASNYTPAEIAVFNASPIGFLTAVPTSHKSHTLAYDETHKTVYTYDGKHREAGLWSFPDPVPGCSGPTAARILEGAISAGTTICRVMTTAGPG